MTSVARGPISISESDSPAQSAAQGRTLLNPRRLAVIICVILAVTGRLCFLLHPYGSDGAMFVYMGKLTANGGRIGVELIDNKFPTVGLMVSGAWRLFGAYWPAYVLLQTGMVIAAVLLLARSMRRNVGPQAAVATALYGIVYLNFRFVVDGGFQLETIQVFFAMLAAASALSALKEDDLADSFLVGLASGTAAMLKPSGLAVLAAFGITMILLRRRAWRTIAHGAAALAGVAIPALVTFIYLAWANLLSQVPVILRQISAYAANSRSDETDIAKWVIVALLGGFPLFVRGFVCRRPQFRIKAKLDDIAFSFALIWLAAEAAGIIAQRRMYPYHFIVIIPPLALMFGLIPRQNRLLPMSVAFIPALLFSWVGVRQSLNIAENPCGRTPISAYLASHAQPGERIWRDYAMRTLVETDLQPGSRYISTFLWANSDQAPLDYCDGMLRDFQDRKPKYIVLPTDDQAYLDRALTGMKELEMSPPRAANFAQAWDNLRAYVKRYYVVEATVGRETVYRRMVPIPLARLEE